MNIPVFSNQLKNDLKKTEGLILKTLAAQHQFMNRLNLHLAQAGGKRIRPSLLLLASRAARPGRPLKQFQKIYALAAGVELIHLASLIHDDVLDHSEIRRGRKTVNALWGNPLSILLGDHIYVKAAHLVSRNGDPRIYSLVTRAAAFMCEGQMLELLNQSNKKLSEETYLEIIMKKTAVLMSSCCQVGALAQNASPGVVRAMERFGKAVGMAFQLVDDLLDVYSNPKELGKPLGSDFSEGYLTLPLIHSLKKCPQKEREKVYRTLERNTSASTMSFIRGFISRYGGRDYVQKKALDYIRLAAKELQHLKPSPARDNLNEILGFIVQRNH